MSIGRRFGTQAIATLLWIVTAAVGLVAILQVYEASRIVAAVVIPYDPMQTVASKYQVIAAARVMLFVGAIAWIVATVVLFERYASVADQYRVLAKRFLVTIVVELAIIGLAAAAMWGLPALALGSP